MPRSALVVMALGVFALVVADVAPSAIKLRGVAGVRVGMELEEVHELLEKIGKGTEGEHEADEAKAIKEGWTLDAGPFKTLAYKTTDDGRIKWVTGWARPGKEIPFAEIGDLTKASRSKPTEAIWNVNDPSGPFRIVARGKDGKASIVSFLSLKSKLPGE